MFGRLVKWAAVATVAIIIGLVALAELALAEGSGPTHFFVRIEMPDTVPAALVEHDGEALFCATGDALVNAGIIVDATYGCEQAMVLDTDPADLVACAELTVASPWCPVVETSSQTSLDFVDGSADGQ